MKTVEIDVQKQQQSSRWCELLARYGPDNGYAVDLEMTDMLSLKPGLLRLYEAAIQGGRLLEDFGLAPLADLANTLVCEATLCHESGRVVASARIAMPVVKNQDLADLQAAARQQLLQVLGFRQPDDDDVTVPAQMQPDLSVVPAVLSPSEDVTLTPAKPVAVTEKPESVATGVASTDDAALAMLRRQLANLAHQKGQAVPVVNTKAEAQAALKALMSAKA